MITNQIEVETIARSSSDWVTTQTLRTLLKSNLGLNARQVTCSAGHSNQYLTITVRDASVDVAAVEAFAKNFATWQMDNTDYCSGQSVHVKTTKEVDSIHAAPHIEEIKRTIPLCTMDSGYGLSNGTVLWLDCQGFYVGRDQKRGHYIRQWDAENGTEWAINGLALQMATV